MSLGRDQSSLLDFTPEKIEENATALVKVNKEEEYDASVMEHLSKKTAKEILEGLRKGHPKPEFGESDGTWRFFYMDECGRRGKQLLIELGWPTEMDSKYINIRTGEVETLEFGLNDMCHEENAGWKHLWAVVEHDVPFDEKKLNWKSIKYNIANIERENRQIESVKGCKTADDVPGAGCEAPATIKKHAKQSMKLYQEDLDEELKRCKDNNIEVNFEDMLCKKCRLFFHKFYDKQIIGDHVCICKEVQSDIRKEHE